MDNIYQDRNWWRKNVKVGDWVKVELLVHGRGEPSIYLFEVGSMKPHSVEPIYFVIADANANSNIYATQVKRVIEIRRSQIEYVEAKIDETYPYRERLEKDGSE